jgi:hypothetical protein
MHDEELTALDLRYNIAALIMCVCKRGHPKVEYEDDPRLFETTYDTICNDYFSSEEVISALEIIRKII